MKTKAKHTGIGAGLFGGAGIFALFGLGTLIATAILALALVLDAWLAALIVAVVLFLIAGLAGLFGKKQIDEGVPPVPERPVEHGKKDDEEEKGAGQGPAYAQCGPGRGGQGTRGKPRTQRATHLTT